MKGVADAENVSGIVCVAHTEGGEDRTPNNLDLLLRTLSGFMVNPNVGAVLSLDHGGQEAVTNEMLRSYLENNNYPIEDVPHEFMSLEGNFRADLERAKSVVSGWLEEVNGARRTEEPASELKIGLQWGIGRLRGLGEPARRVGIEGDRAQRRRRTWPRRTSLSGPSATSCGM